MRRAYVWMHVENIRPTKKIGTRSNELLNDRLVEDMSASVTVPADVLQSAPPAPLAATASGQEEHENGLLFRVLYYAMLTF